MVVQFLASLDAKGRGKEGNPLYLRDIVKIKHKYINFLADI